MRAYIVGHKTIEKGGKLLVIVHFNYETAHTDGLSCASVCVDMKKYLFYRKYEEALCAFWSKKNNKVVLYVPKDQIESDIEM